MQARAEIPWWLGRVSRLPRAKAAADALARKLLSVTAGTFVAALFAVPSRVLRDKLKLLYQRSKKAAPTDCNMPSAAHWKQMYGIHVCVFFFFGVWFTHINCKPTRIDDFDTPIGNAMPTSKHKAAIRGAKLVGQVFCHYGIIADASATLALASTEVMTTLESALKLRKEITGLELQLQLPTKHGTAAWPTTPGVPQRASVKAACELVTLLVNCDCPGSAHVLTHVDTLLCCD